MNTTPIQPLFLSMLLAGAVGCGKSSESQETSQPPSLSSAEVVAINTQNEELPYNLGSRLMPSGSNVEKLLPPQAGPYRRAPIKQAGKESIYANYQSGNSTIFVELGICADMKEAQSAVETAKAETDAEFPGAQQTFAKWQDIVCFKTVTPTGALVAWTRGAYYFSARANGGEKELDQFMAAFPW